MAMLLTLICMTQSFNMWFSKDYWRHDFIAICKEYMKIDRLSVRHCKINFLPLSYQFHILQELVLLYKDIRIWNQQFKYQKSIKISKILIPSWNVTLRWKITFEIKSLYTKEKNIYNFLFKVCIYCIYLEKIWMTSRFHMAIVISSQKVGKHFLQYLYFMLHVMELHLFII